MDVMEWRELTTSVSPFSFACGIEETSGDRTRIESVCVCVCVCVCSHRYILRRIKLVFVCMLIHHCMYIRAWESVCVRVSVRVRAFVRVSHAYRKRIDWLYINLMYSEKDYIWRYTVKSMTLLRYFTAIHLCFWSCCSQDSFQPSDWYKRKIS